MAAGRSRRGKFDTMTAGQHYESLLDPLEAALPRLTTLKAMLGFDGTVDVICKPVQSRIGPGSDFTPFKYIRDFGERISSADNKSALIEIVIEQEKIGGNGPIMATALAASGIKIDYIGTAGIPQLHPAYANLPPAIQLHSIANPAVTHALEFENGKIMLPALANYEQVTAKTLQQLPGREALTTIIQQSNLCAMLNWTCLPGWESILTWLSDDLLPTISGDRQRLFFFDLADPSMQSRDKLKSILRLIAAFEQFGRVILGMNLNELQQISEALGISSPTPESESVKAALAAVRSELGINMTMGHPVDFAACAAAEGSWSVAGPHTSSPSITTGAGDHLNAGFCLGLMLDLTPEDVLKLAVLYSGYYVRQATAPKLTDIPNFIQSLN